MTRRWIRNLVTAATVTAVPALASAADEPAARNPEHGALFKKLDANGDGQIAKDEVPEEQRRLLERLIDNHDKNKDGKLSADEFSAGLSEERPRGEAAPAGDRGAAGRPGAMQFNPEEIFRRMDRNGDGKLTADETPEERREFFKQMIARVDGDKDGAASLDEFKQGFPGGGRPGGEPGRPGNPQPGGDGLARALDTDKNGELSADEIAAASESLKKLDRNGDGKLTREEVGPPPQVGQGGQPAQPGRPGEGLRPNPETAIAYFKQMDKDGDGKLSKDEAPERMRENFDRIDANSDGKVDETELRQMLGRIGMARPGDQPRRPEGTRPDGARPDARRPESDRRPTNDAKPQRDDAKPKD